MKSASLALLLIVNLLMCPVRCLSHETKAADGQESSVAVCACCSHGDETPSSETPQPCSDGCECENCICEGALLEADVELSAPMMLFGDAQPSLFAVHPIVTQAEFVARDKTPALGQLLSGRELRVSHQSWLL